MPAEKGEGKLTYIGGIVLRRCLRWDYLYGGI